MSVTLKAPSTLLPAILAMDSVNAGQMSWDSFVILVGATTGDLAHKVAADHVVAAAKDQLPHSVIRYVILQRCIHCLYILSLEKFWRHMVNVATKAGQS